MRNFIEIHRRDIYNFNMNKPDLIKSAEFGDLDGVKSALDMGEDINLQDSWSGITALHAACARGHYHVVEFLLTCEGVNPSIVDKAGRLPGTLAIDFARNDIFDLIQRFMLDKPTGPEMNGP